MTPKVKKQAGRFLGLGRGGEDRALVRFEDLEPGRDVAGVMVEVGDRKTQFGPEDDLFGGAYACPLLSKRSSRSVRKSRRASAITNTVT